MRFDDAGLTIGRSNSPMSVRISNDQVSILQNGGEIAYFSDSKLYVRRGEFLHSLKLGNFEFAPQSNGNLSFIRAVT